MTQQIVKNPERFNDSVILSTNLFMDIISEGASGHVGSIGNVYSGNFGDNFAMFEPAHGSARNMPIRIKSIPLLQSCLVLG